jgi:tetratricopeptide (TPR) repeat protein
MYQSSLFLAAALVGTTVALTSVALVQPVAMANSATEVEGVARSVTVKIKLQKRQSIGSGIIVHRKGDLYTLVTNQHVVCGEGRGRCSQLLAEEIYKLELPDGQQYQVQKSSIKILGNNLDLAIIQFRSNRNYKVAKISNTEKLKVNDNIYTAGFPAEQPGFSFSEGGVIATVEKRMIGDGGGYTIIYDALTLPGMSGSGVFNSSGQLVAVHGQGDRFKENTDTYNKSTIDTKMGLNRGIPIRWLVQNLADLGIYLENNNNISKVKVARPQVPASADEFFITGYNSLIDPGGNVAAGKEKAIQDLSKAIQINPQYAVAYFIRAIVYEQIHQFYLSLDDYDKAISINPRAFLAYSNRGILKHENLNDYPGALNDYNQAISINPKYDAAYYNRGLLKHLKLNDLEGALADYSTTISLNPGAFLAYNNRGILKYENFSDYPGALNDYNQSVSINSKYTEAYYNRANLKYTKLSDYQGALLDYNRAISIDPKFIAAYYNRALLKYTNLNDRAGAIQDFRQVVRLSREQGQTENLDRAIQALKALEATE